MHPAAVKKQVMAGVDLDNRDETQGRRGTNHPTLELAVQR